MTLLSPQSEDKLGCHEIRAMLEARALTEEGKAQCLQMQPFRKPGLIEPELERVKQFRDLMMEEDSFVFEFTGSVSGLLSQISVPGNWLRAHELFNIMKWLRMVREMLGYFRSRKERYPAIWELLNGLDWDKSTLASIESVLDPRGMLHDHASPALGVIRKEINAQSGEVRRMLQATLRAAISNGWSDASEITIRNDRYVVPMKADFKGKIKGFVHDVSQSGQTIFVEPAGALELNNALRELQIREQNEIVRILTTITDLLRQQLPSFLNYKKAITKVDFSRAKARLAMDMKAEKPVFTHNGGPYKLVKGRHPLLLAKHGFKTSEIVPLSFVLDSGNRILLISGPNAGGKSVTLKTAGILQWMVQSGLLPPCGEGSEFRHFRKIFVDIGDEQSILSDLSTYTSHLRNLKEMMAGMDQDTLFLLDEFGAGTDPKLGGAIAEAFLMRFVESGAYGVVTTHYGNLKRFAESHNGIQNAAMQFNPSSLTPTYQIDVGVPGRSYAFEIARNVGVPEEILEDASSRIEGKELQTESLLLRLEAQREELEAVLKENREKNQELKTLLGKNRDRIVKIQAEEGKILGEAQKRAQALIDAANAKIEQTIREIRESQAEKERTKELRKALSEMLPEPNIAQSSELVDEDGDVEFESAEAEQVPELLPGAQIALGDWVQLEDAASYGEVLDLQGTRAVVAVGDMRITVKLKGLIKIKPPKAGRTFSSGYSTYRLRQKQHATTELRVQGFRVEQALPVLQKFMDDAIGANVKDLRILHGKGTGALREAIRTILATLPEVVSFEDEHADRGGEGWTIVKLK